MIERAMKEAKKSKFRQRLGAVIVSGGAVIGYGYNSIRLSKSHPKVIGSPKYPESCHAERAAILMALKKGSLKKLVGSVIYVVRINNKGQPRNAKPCEECECLIKSVGIKKIVHT